MKAVMDDGRGKMNADACVFVLSLAIMAVFSLFSSGPAAADHMMVLEDAKARIIFEPGVNQGAEEVAKIFPEIKERTESLFKWRYSLRASIVLINNRERFLQYADHPITVAFADPANNTVVLDFSTISSKPFSLETTLAHEFCHLLLHRHLPDIPRWLDEGLCQWASGGLDEIMFDRGRSVLNQAAITGRFLDFGRLENRFPRAENTRVLAYEQSKNFVTYLDRRFGTEKLRAVLEEMKNGATVYESAAKIYDTPFETLEKDWMESLRSDWTWLTYLSTHIDIFLFVAAALITVVGFIKFLRRKRRYRDAYWDDDDEEEEDDDYFDF